MALLGCLNLSKSNEPTDWSDPRYSSLYLFMHMKYTELQRILLSYLFPYRQGRLLTRYRVQ